jgi:hypothetical protein
MLVVALGTGSSALAQCNATLADGIGPTGGTYNLGDTIEYEITLFVPASIPDVITFCELTDVDVYCFPPGDLPPGDSPCENIGLGTLVASGLTLTPGGALITIDSTDHASLAYEITEADCTEPLEIVANMAVEFLIEGEGDVQCDEKEAVNDVNPVEAPECGILGPIEVCEGDGDVEYESEYEADTYAWSVTGEAVIDGPADGPTVLVDPTGSAGYTVELEVCNEAGEEDCCSDCDLEVEVIEAPDCAIDEGPDSVCEGTEDIVYCYSGIDTPDSYLWEITGNGTIDGPDNGECVTVDAGDAGSFTLTLTVCFDDPECCDTCELTVDVIEVPECGILGPEEVCVDDEDVLYESEFEADTYAWVVTGDGVIDGADDGPSILVDPTGPGGYTVELEVCNDSDLEPCCSDCSIRVTVDECGGVFCTFTQGFYGNKGGKACDGTKTKDLIAACLPITVGSDGRSITFGVGSADCVITRLPAGGTPSALPDGLGNVIDECDKDSKDALADVLKKQGRFNNVLIGQVVALTLNLCVSDTCLGDDSGDLAGWLLPDAFCTVPYGDPEACPMHYSIPGPLVGKTVQELLDEANAVLAGEGTASISDIYTAVTAINEGFDECREIVTCPETETDCSDECDNDGDGYTDCDDSDCDSDEACIE